MNLTSIDLEAASKAFLCALCTFGVLVVLWEMLTAEEP